MNCAHCAALLPVEPVQMGEQRYCCGGCAAAAGLLAQLQEHRQDGMEVAAAGRFADCDRAEVAARLLVPGNRGEVLHATVDNLRCAACVRSLERQLRQLPGIVSVQVDAVSGRASIEFERGRLPLSRLLASAEQAGHGLHPDGVARDLARLRRERRAAQLRLGITLILSVQGMMFVEALYYGAAGEGDAVRDVFRWLALICAVPVVLYGGAPFLRAGLAQLRARAPGMDLLVSLSVWLAFLSSGWMTFTGIAGPIYLDAALMFVGLLSIARHLEEATRRRASAQVLALGARAHALVQCHRAGQSLRVHPEGLQPGDELQVAPGEEVPADGVVLQQPALLSEALLSGESAALYKAVGACVLAGSVVAGASALQLRVSASGSHTVRAALGRRVEQASAQRPALALWGERLASRFVWWMLVVAALAGGIWWTLDPAMALPVTLAVLAGGCPCALAMAVPAASAAAYGRLAADGVLVLRGHALQALARVDHVVFDKTGTLTTPAIGLAEQRLAGGLDSDRALAIAAALERGHAHPLARLLQLHDSGLEVRQPQVHPLGVSGCIDGVSYRLGRADFAEGSMPVDGEVVLAQVDGPARAVFTWEEQLKPDAPALVAAIRALGARVHLLSGDAPARAAHIAGRLGVDDWLAAVTPEGKLDYLHKLRAGVEGAPARCIAMVGDGHNDAPGLAGADVSLALADGADAARQAADIVLCSPRLLRIGEAVQLARRLRRICRQSLAWALLYNLGMLPLAISGVLTPSWAALGMSLSSLLVTLNALRLRRATRLDQSDGRSPALVLSGEVRA